MTPPETPLECVELELLGTPLQGPQGPQGVQGLTGLRGITGESYADILRRTGLYGVLPTDSDNVAISKLNANAATSAAFAEEFSGPAYDTIGDGEDATTPGQFFRVPIPATDPVEYTRYQRVSGGSVEAAQLATTTALASPTGAALVGNQLPAGSGLRTQPVSEFIEGGPLQPAQFTGSDEQQLNRAIVEAGTVRNDALGQQVLIPRGIITTTAAFNMANRAMLSGVNKRGSIIQADAAHAGPSMVTVINGASSTFDNRLQDLTLDCNDVAGLSGVISSAWQEGGGLRDVLIQKFTEYGLDIVDTVGGVSQLLIENSEFFGSEDGALSCIRYDDPSLVSSCILMMSNLAVTGGVPVAADTDPARAAARAGMPAAVDILNGSSTSVGVHIEVAERGFRIDGNGRHIIIGAKGSAPNGTANAGVETLVEVAATFTGTLTMIGCSRNGATNFVKDNRVGGVGTISYDMPEFKISPEPPVYPGSLVARGWFVASNDATPNITNCRGVASVTRDSNGQWTIVTTRSLPSADDWVIPMPSIATNGLEPPSVEILGVNSFRFKLRTLGGTPTGTPVIHFTAFHL